MKLLFGLTLLFGLAFSQIVLASPGQACGTNGCSGTCPGGTCSNLGRVCVCGNTIRGVQDQLGDLMKESVLQGKHLVLTPAPNGKVVINFVD